MYKNSKYYCKNLAVYNAFLITASHNSQI